MELTYLKESQEAKYSLMLMNRTLRNHLRNINKQAEKMLFQHVNDMAKAEGIT